MQAIVTIGDVQIFADEVTDYNVELNDLDSDNTGRSESGMLVRDVIRKDVAKVTMSVRCSEDRLPVIVSAIQPNAFSATIRAPVDGGYKTCTMYSGAKSMQLAIQPKESNRGARWDLSFSLVEY